MTSFSWLIHAGHFTHENHTHNPQQTQLQAQHTVGHSKKTTTSTKSITFQLINNPSIANMELISNTKFEDDEIKQIDTTGLSWGDMILLKKSDPFLYYSIPGNRDAKLPGEDVDVSDLNLPSSASRSRSFTAVETAADGSNDEVKNLLRHSLTDVAKIARRGSDVGLQHPSFTINESFTIDEPRATKKKPSKRAHCRSKSLADAIITVKPSTAMHRRTVSAYPQLQSNIVTRKTAISFESYVDNVLEEVIEEMAELQPRMPRDGPSADEDEEVRRGSLLEDILFASIEQLRDEGGLE